MSKSRFVQLIDRHLAMNPSIPAVVEHLHDLRRSAGDLRKSERHYWGEYLRLPEDGAKYAQAIRNKQH